MRRNVRAFLEKISGADTGTGMDRSMQHMIEKNQSAKKYVLMYTVTFLLFAGGAFLTFLYTRRTFICEIDGLPQYYPYMVYMGKAMRSFLQQIMQGHFAQQLFDFTIGLGSEVSVVFRPHPLDLLSVLVPARYTEILYQFISLFSMYLSGLAFSAFAYEWRQKWEGLLTGSMVYVFCGFTMRLGLEHPAFLLPMVYFPLMLLLAERIIRKKEGAVFFALVVAIGWASGYPFMYISTMGFGLYMLLRLKGICEQEGFGGYVRVVLLEMGLYLMGTCMAAVFYLPSVAALALSGRSGGRLNIASLWIYSLSRYYQAFLYLVTPYLGLSHQTYASFPVIVLPALAALFTTRKKHALLKWAVIVSFLLLLIPFGSYVMAALSYLNGRWMYLMALVMGLVCVYTFESLSNLRGKAALVAGILPILFAVVGILAYKTQNVGELASTHPLRYLAVGFVELVAATLVLLLIPRVQWMQKHASALLLAGTFLSVAINGYVTYSNDFSGLANEFERVGESWQKIQNSPYTYLARLSEDLSDDTAFFRFDTDADLIASGEENYPMVLGYRSTSMYNSFMNGSVLDFLLDQESTGANAVHRLRGFASRTGDEALMNVKYYLTETADTSSVPYGYEKLEAYSDEAYSVYENQHPLSFGYTYDTYMTWEDYNALSGVEKEQALLRAVVLDEDDLSKIGMQANGDASGKTDGQEQQGISQQDDVKQDNSRRGIDLKRMTSLPVQIEHMEVPLPGSTETVERTEYGYYVKESKGTVSFSCPLKAGYECYLRLTGFTIGSRYIKVRVKTSEGISVVPLRGASQTYALDRENFCVRLGYSELDGEDEVTVLFPDKGNYRLAGLELYYVPMADYETAVAGLNETTLTHTVFANNTITGDVQAKQDGFMVFSIPASAGWSARVDGEKVPLYQVNVGMLGMPVTEGDHTVELTYRSPGLTAARVMTVAGWAVFLAVCVLPRRRRKNQSEKHAPGAA